jgi:hypothetical protein
MEQAIRKSMPLPPDLLANLYDLYLRAAVELRQITLLELEDLCRLKSLFGIDPADVEQIRESLLNRN